MQTLLIHPVISLLSRVFLPVALGVVALVRTGGQGWDIATANDQDVNIEGGILRVSMLIKNPGRSQLCIEYIDITVSDSLGTFTLRNQTPTILISPDSCTRVEIVASNFQPLRLSRKCIYRARLVDKSGEHRTVATSFINLWPSDYFSDGETNTEVGSALIQDSLPASSSRHPRRRRFEVDLDSVE